MNKRQKEILQSQLNDEKQALKALKEIYKQALEDCNEKIRAISARADMENLQSIIYQTKYQEVLKKQIEGILDALQSNEFNSITEYLQKCYQEGFLGTMYDLYGQGIPVVIPMDQKAVIAAIQTNSKLSTSLYTRLGEDVADLKRAIRTELSRGIANGSSWNQIAYEIAGNMNHSPLNKALNNAIRIARTEGHRVQIQSALDAQNEAKKAGADVVKQWDSTLDGATRDTHRKLDGQIREIDDDFEVEGKRASAPGMFGRPEEDINCRCALLQRARWALDQDELDTLKKRAEYFELDKTKDLEDFKEKYLKASDKIANAPEIRSDKITKSIKEFDDVLQNSDGVDAHVTRMSLYSQYTEYKENTNIDTAFLYNSYDDVIYYNPKAKNYEMYDMNFVQSHELSHRLDMLEYRSFENDDFLDAIDICRKKVADNASEIQKWFEEGGKYENDFAISDIISALSRNSIDVPAGHSNEYWETTNAEALEIFANVSSIDVLGGKQKEEFKYLLSEIYDVYKDIVK